MARELLDLTDFNSQLDGWSDFKPAKIKSTNFYEHYKLWILLWILYFREVLWCLKTCKERQGQLLLNGFEYDYKRG